MNGGFAAFVCVATLGCASRVYGPYQTGFAPETDESACEAGQTKACLRLAAAYDSGLGVSADDERSQALYDRACQLHNYEGCVSLGVQLEARSTTQPDGPARAMELYRSACDHDVRSGCLFLGYAYAEGRAGLNKDATRAAALIQKACRLGDSEACKLGQK
jgi:TPR repeat protein